MFLKVLRPGKVFAAFFTRVSLANGVRKDVIAKRVNIVENGLARVARDFRFAARLEEATFAEDVALKHVFVHELDDL